ncbi:hypothetical protein I7I48_01854 [Histoplasma ohiense]|nr:hypothetical protein I7I48_01854 [Histoplasma ohiense (nom. inval.)]
MNVEKSWIIGGPLPQQQLCAMKERTTRRQRYYKLQKTVWGSNECSMGLWMLFVFLRGLMSENGQINNCSCTDASRFPHIHFCFSEAAEAGIGS